MIDLTKWANGSHNSFGDAMYMAALSTVLVFAVLGVVWRAGRRLRFARRIVSHGTPSHCWRTPNSSYVWPLWAASDCS